MKEPTSQTTANEPARNTSMTQYVAAGISDHKYRELLQMAEDEDTDLTVLAGNYLEEGMNA